MSRVSQYAVVPLFLSLVASTNDDSRPSSVLWCKCFYNCMVMCSAYFKAFLLYVEILKGYENSLLPPKLKKWSPIMKIKITEMNVKCYDSEPDEESIN